MESNLGRNVYFSVCTVCSLTINFSNENMNKLTEPHIDGLHYQV